MDWKRFGREIGTYAIATVVIGSLFWVLMRLFAGPLPETNEKVVTLIVGFLIAKGGTIVDYYFGSSKGSSDKTEAMTASTTVVQ